MLQSDIENTQELSIVDISTVKYLTDYLERLSVRKEVGCKEWANK